MSLEKELVNGIKDHHLVTHELRKLTYISG